MDLGPIAILVYLCIYRFYNSSEYFRGMNRLEIKPLSVNEVWQGKRYKTQKYKKYRADLQLILKNVEIPEGELFVSYEFGVSNMCSDVDNLVKPFQDALQDKYGFNDSKIKSFFATKTKVKKGQEFIKFNISKYDAFENWLEGLDF